MAKHRGKGPRTVISALSLKIRALLQDFRHQPVEIDRTDHRGFR